MRQVGLLLVMLAIVSPFPRAQAPSPPVPAPAAAPAQDAAAAPAARPAPVGTMSELMLKVIYPYSDAMFYIQRNPPEKLVMSCTSCHMHYRPSYGRRNYAPATNAQPAPQK